MFDDIIRFIKKLYKSDGIIPLHEPRFIGNEKKYLNDCIDSTYVSYLGDYVTKFEETVKEYTGAGNAVAIANGTLALHMSLLIAGVRKDDEVLIQGVTFVATANAVNHCGAIPVFMDSDRITLGMSPEKLEEFLKNETFAKDDEFRYNRITGRRIFGCVPTHVFGHPVKIDQIKDICSRYNVVLIEDAAESLGSFYGAKHTGTFGKLGILSFNGNKIITTGGGGMIMTNDESITKKIRHITATAKVPHKWEFYHDEIGYNYRLPNVNAAIGCAQMENLEVFLDNKRELAIIYQDFFERKGIAFISEPEGCRSNYWLNAVILKDRTERDQFLEHAHDQGVKVRPIWRLLNELPMFKGCQAVNLDNARWLEDRVVNLPSSVRI